LNRFLLDKYKALIGVAFRASFMGEAFLDAGEPTILAEMIAPPTTRMGSAEVVAGDANMRGTLDAINISDLKGEMQTGFSLTALGYLVTAFHAIGSLSAELEISGALNTAQAVPANARTIRAEADVSGYAHLALAMPTSAVSLTAEPSFIGTATEADTTSISGRLSLPSVSMFGTMEEMSAPSLEGLMASALEISGEMEEALVVRFHGEIVNPLTILANANVARIAEVEDFYSGTVDSVFYNKTMSDDLYLVIL